MRTPKVIPSLNPAESRLLLYALVHFRNKLLTEGRYADAVDEVIVRCVQR